MTRSVGVSAALLAALIGAATASADERKFTYSYESKTLPQGAWEFEQWATLQTRQESGRSQAWSFREEIEYGLADRLTTALYLNWEYEAVPGEHEVEFETVSSEWKWKLMDAVADPVGLLLYGEVAAGPEEQELELKLIVDKQVGDFRFVYNFVVEFERAEEETPAGDEWEKESAFEHTFGISYQANPNFAVGVESLFVQKYEEIFEELEATALFMGPNVHVATGGWWVTVTALRQVDRGSADLDLDHFTQYEFRLIFGIHF